MQSLTKITVNHTTVSREHRLMWRLLKGMGITMDPRKVAYMMIAEPGKLHTIMQNHRRYMTMIDVDPLMAMMMFKDKPSLTMYYTKAMLEVQMKKRGVE